MNFREDVKILKIKDYKYVNEDNFLVLLVFQEVKQYLNE